MKKISAILVLALMAFAAKAQPTMAITFGVFSLPNGGSLTSPFPIPQGTVYTFTFTVKNSGDQDLTLSQTSGHYVVLSGNAEPYVTLDESNISSNPVVAPSGNVTFSVTSMASMPPGNYSLSLSMANNDPSNNPYTGTVNFTITPATAIISAKDVGITLYPSPSTDGRITVMGDILLDKVVVYGNNGVSEEFKGDKYFHTRQKGLLIVRLYTDKGVVEDKLLVQ